MLTNVQMGGNYEHVPKNNRFTLCTVHVLIGNKWKSLKEMCFIAFKMPERSVFC